MAASSEMIAESREVIFEDMDQVTKKAAEAGSKKLQAGFQVAVLIQYDLGEIVNRVFEADHLNETERKAEIKKLAAYWNQPNLNTSTLYDLRNVSAAFDREFVKAQVEEKLNNGTYLTWSHFKELQKISSESKQLSILKKIRQHSWSANELALELQGRKEAAVKRSGGRKPTLPKTPNAMVQKLFTTVQQADNYITAIADPLGDMLELSSSDFDGQFIENVTNTLDRISTTAKHFTETEKQLKKVLKRAQSVVSQASSEEEEPEDVSPAPAKKKRGRPSKSSSGVTVAVSAKRDKTDPDSMASSGPKRRRGRPRRAAVVEVEDNSATVIEENEEGFYDNE